MISAGAAETVNRWNSIEIMKMFLKDAQINKKEVKVYKAETQRLHTS